MNRIVRTAQKTKTAQEVIRWVSAAAASAQKYRRPEGASLRLEVTAFLGIPSSYTLEHKLRCEQGLDRPQTTPDVDNILKLVADAFNKHLYDDDKRVVEGECIKWYVPDRTMEPWMTVELFECYSMPPAPEPEVHAEIVQAFGNWVLLTDEQRRNVMTKHLGLCLDLQEVLAG